jgi:hypothetical protein
MTWGGDGDMNGHIKEKDQKESRKEASKKEYKVVSELITVKTVDGSTIRGNINLGVKERVSDLFTKSDNPFIVLTGVTLEDGSRPVLFLNKRYIVWVEPETK